jgi:hypothetical protein
MTVDPLAAEIAATDVRLAELVNRRIELALALRRREQELGLSVADRALSEHGVRELHRFVLDLTRREAARAESRRQAVRRRSVAAPSASATRIPPNVTAMSTTNLVPRVPVEATRASAS